MTWQASGTGKIYGKFHPTLNRKCLATAIASHSPKHLAAMAKQLRHSMNTEHKYYDFSHGPEASAETVTIPASLEPVPITNKRLESVASTSMRLWPESLKPLDSCSNVQPLPPSQHDISMSTTGSWQCFSNIETAAVIVVFYNELDICLDTKWKTPISVNWQKTILLWKTCLQWEYHTKYGIYPNRSKSR